ncbi:MAG: hypothetical protein GC188_01905 [Alphaproteobacteria bacterium]|nr:hypothetical protein [Alphaproteobacteria bacterium]
MSSIPGAHASLGFGRKRIDFYASPGVTTGDGPRRGEHDIRDADGATHTMRLSRPDTPLESGETVTVLRAQSGPDHGSRPVAVINHDRNAWTRTAPDATTVLARSGITRSFNWWMAMLLFMVTAIALAWPDIRLFMLEVDPGIFASLPDINVFVLAADTIPALPGFDLAAAIPGFTGLAGQAGLPGWLSPQALAFVLPLTLLALITYLARSWRILWAPVYAVAAIATGLALNADAPLIPSMLALGGVALLFCIGGFINRTRDAGRLEGRIARLSENILRHPPAETVAVPAAAGAALASAAATAHEDAPVEADDVAADSDDLPSDEELAAARSDAGDDDPAPATSLRATPDELGVEETSDRDMVLPPPPPLANRSVNGAAESGDAAAGASGNMTAAATATASAMHAPEPAPAEPPALAEVPASEAAAETGPETPDTPATATASAMQAPSPGPLSPAPDTPAPEDIHAFAAADSGERETLMSSRDIADAEDAPDSPDAPDAAPVTPPASVSNAAASDDVSDPFMAPKPSGPEAPEAEDSETPRQTDS